MGVIGFTRVLRRELEGTGIHLTLFCPGSTATAMTRASLDFGKGTAQQPHHGPEIPAAAMVDAVRQRKKLVRVSAKPKMQAIATWLDKLFPSLMDAYWHKHADPDHYESAARSGR
jgi:short-subunit dehydrogenase